ncbi:MAG: hypothetical protein HQL77_16335 [Magnetococcales bacterium]|nr:hypothetical protein [Magnetococcales bacterium]
MVFAPDGGCFRCPHEAIVGVTLSSAKLEQLHVFKQFIFGSMFDPGWVLAMRRLYVCLDAITSLHQSQYGRGKLFGDGMPSWLTGRDTAQYNGQRMRNIIQGTFKILGSFLDPKAARFRAPRPSGSDRIYYKVYTLTFHPGQDNFGQNCTQKLPEFGAHCRMAWLTSRPIWLTENISKYLILKVFTADKFRDHSVDICQPGLVDKISVNLAV